ncbi:predicted protein [Histoplasma capsulatum var. duboisii H88]|uniref:Predicted protein n=1 Tax=Ajellomyces capsulatus (strain H88) TaxID=544711 RepID=F0UU08_AJEC8|nr:predicted protein [Histoplasma capsulatum var. duboisii H88]
MGYSATIESGVKDRRFRGVFDEDEAIDMLVSRKSYKNENQSKRQTRRNTTKTPTRAGGSGHTIQSPGQLTCSLDQFSGLSLWEGDASAFGSVSGLWSGFSDIADENLEMRLRKTQDKPTVEPPPAF